MATQRLPRIAFLPGEGVGPEVVAQARRVLYALRGPGFDFEALDAPPIRTRPSIPLSQSIPSGSFHKPLILIHQRADRMKNTITEN